MQSTPLPGTELVRAAKYPFAESRFRSVLLRRALANLIDWTILTFALAVVGFVFVLTKIITFGLLSIPTAIIGLALPFVYFIGYIGGPSSATPGMKVMDIEVRDLSGLRPDLFQAGLRTFLYSASIVALTPLILLVVFFNRRRRALHDILSATIVVRRMEDDAL
jgi:uncharacterized RDD family membrane protein YckC